MRITLERCADAARPRCSVGSAPRCALPCTPAGRGRPGAAGSRERQLSRGKGKQGSGAAAAIALVDSTPAQVLPETAGATALATTRATMVGHAQARKRWLEWWTRGLQQLAAARRLESIIESRTYISKIHPEEGRPQRCSLASSD